MRRVVDIRCSAGHLTDDVVADHELPPCPTCGAKTSVSWHGGQAPGLANVRSLTVDGREGTVAQIERDCPPGFMPVSTQSAAWRRAKEGMLARADQAAQEAGYRNVAHARAEFKNPGAARADHAAMAAELHNKSRQANGLAPKDFALKAANVTVGGLAW